MIYRLLSWVALMLVDVALGLTIADPRTHATSAGWVLYAAGSLLWVMLWVWLLLVEDSLP